MPKSETKSADTTQAALVNQEIANLVEVLRQTQFLAYLGAQSTMLFSGTCKATLKTLSKARKKCSENSRSILLVEIALGDLNLFNRIRATNTHHFRHSSLLFADVVRNNEVLTKQIATKRGLLLQDPIVLLAAVVQGNEDWAREILKANPELIRDKSATVRDLTGKLITGLTPLQAAICAGDDKMIRMMEEVLQQQGYDSKAEIARQFAEIFPEGIDAVETAQKDAADKFKKSTLQNLLNAINAATPEQVQFELETPGRELNQPDDYLNTILHKFRRWFTATSYQEQEAEQKRIFNPLYLAEAFEFYVANFDKFKNLECRDLYWRQVIGYIQRHVPACLWQAFVRGIYDIVQEGALLTRTFRLWHNHNVEMRAGDGDLNNLGFKWGVVVWGGVMRRVVDWRGWGCGRARVFKTYCEQKNQVWRSYARADRQTTSPGLPVEQERNRVRYSYCSIS